MPTSYSHLHWVWNVFSNQGQNIKRTLKNPEEKGERKRGLRLFIIDIVVDYRLIYTFTFPELGTSHRYSCSHQSRPRRPSSEMRFFASKTVLSRQSREIPSTNNTVGGIYDGGSNGFTLLRHGKYKRSSPHKTNLQRHPQWDWFPNKTHLSPNRDKIAPHRPRRPFHLLHNSYPPSNNVCWTIWNANLSPYISLVPSSTESSRHSGISIRPYIRVYSATRPVSSEIVLSIGPVSVDVTYGTGVLFPTVWTHKGSQKSGVLWIARICGFLSWDCEVDGRRGGSRRS